MGDMDSDRTDVCPFGRGLQGYWDKLSLPERRMRMDAQGLYSLDVQQVGIALAAKIRSARVVDPFCGVGGAAIAFAIAGKRVEAVEIDSARLEMARYNAALFQVASLIDFHLGDALSFLERGAEQAAIYLDPPWGGPSYGRLDRFLLKHFSPSGELLLEKALAVSEEVLFKLPRNFEFAELAGVLTPGEVLRNELDGRLEYFTAVFRRA